MNLEKKKNFIINFMYFIVLSIIFLLIFNITTTYLLPFIIGIVISYFVQKPANFLSIKFKFKKEICAAILSAIIFLIVIILLMILLYFIYHQVSELISYFLYENDKNNNFLLNFFYNIKEFVQQEKLDHFAFGFGEDAIKNFILKITDLLSKFASEIIKKTPKFLISSIITIVATFYISKDYNKISKFIIGCVNDDVQMTAKELLLIFNDCFLKFLLGYFWIFIITFIELLLGFFVLGVKKAVLLALLTASLDLLPIIGTGTVLLPWAIILFLNHNFKLAIGLVLLYVFIVIVRNFIEPKIISKQIDINPICTLLFVFLGFKIGGIIGILILPIMFTVIFMYLRKKNINSYDH